LEDVLRTKEEILEYLKEVPDPEIPVINVVELGIIREIVITDKDGTEVVITPTYTGCPATYVIESDIRKKLTEKGVGKFTIRTAIAPPWTTDWISEEGKIKLKNYGIAPPKSLVCPRCGSKNVEMKSFFGSTPCKSLYTCKDCKEPFDYFKCI
jgi:ring-1,2-phenylacetyl-CoA epoxidase subunit PaaD